MDFFDEIDPEDEVRRQAFHQEIDTLMERAGDELDEDLRKIGLYVQGRQVAQVHTPFGMKPALVLSANVGEIAFRSRVQDPEMDKIDRQFREIAAEDQVNGFLETRRELAKELEEGIDEP